MWLDNTAPLTTSHPFHTDVRTNNYYHGFTAALTPDFSQSGNVTGSGTPVALNNQSGLGYSGMPSDILGYNNNTTTYTDSNNVTHPYPGTITSFVTNANSPNPGIAITPPTYSLFPIGINSAPWVGGLAAWNPGSPGLNEADEMNPYSPTRLDAPFGANDLEWLYRYQDVDGTSLQSRLPSLAPVSFLNPLDGTRRRRLFCLDTWEPTNFVWTNDNPQGVFPNNSRFSPLASPSFANLNASVDQNFPNFGTLANRNAALLSEYGVAGNPDTASAFTALANSSTSPYYVQTPSIAHRDRRINLNFPLPVSNNPIEPIRQKWIRETYQLLKAVLPPKAVDTPEELAQLSQYVVNIIDFRDPDATITKFINTDIVVTEPQWSSSATANPVPTTLSFSTGTPPPVAFDPDMTPATDPLAPAYNTAATSLATAWPSKHYLVQYGMEYLPVALNEVLAYQFQTMNTNGPTGTTAPAAGSSSAAPNNAARMLIEVVNMLSRDAINGQTSPLYDTSDMDLTGWDFVVLPDDPQGRPDPFTGQIPLVQSGLYLPMDSTGKPLQTTQYQNGSAVQVVQPYVSIPAAGGSLQYLDAANTNAPPPSTTGPTIASNTPPVANNKNYYYVLGSQQVTQAAAASVPPEWFSATAGPILVDTINQPTIAFPGAAMPATSTSPIQFPPNSSVSPPVSALNAALTTPATAADNPPFTPPAPPTVAPPIPYGYVDLTGSLYQRSLNGNPPTKQPQVTASNTAPTKGLDPGFYYWLYLRRPANPFDSTSDMVVVDSFRFVFFGSQATGWVNNSNPPTPTPAVSPNRHVDWHWWHRVHLLVPASPAIPRRSCGPPVHNVGHRCLRARFPDNPARGRPAAPDVHPRLRLQRTDGHLPARQRLVSSRQLRQQPRRPDFDGQDRAHDECPELARRQCSGLLPVQRSRLHERDRAADGAGLLAGPLHQAILRAGATAARCGELSRCQSSGVHDSATHPRRVPDHSADLLGDQHVWPSGRHDDHGTYSATQRHHGPMAVRGSHRPRR